MEINQIAKTQAGQEALQIARSDLELEQKVDQISAIAESTQDPEAIEEVRWAIDAAYAANEPPPTVEQIAEIERIANASN